MEKLKETHEFRVLKLRRFGIPGELVLGFLVLEVEYIRGACPRVDVFFETLELENHQKYSPLRSVFLCDLGIRQKRLPLRIIAKVLTLVRELLQHMDILLELEDIVGIEVHHNREKLVLARESLRVALPLHQLPNLFELSVLLNELGELVGLVKFDRLHEQYFYVHQALDIQLELLKIDPDRILLHQVQFQLLGVDIVLDYLQKGLDRPQQKVADDELPSIIFRRDLGFLFFLRWFEFSKSSPDLSVRLTEVVLVNHDDVVGQEQHLIIVHGENAVLVFPWSDDALQGEGPFQ